MSACKKSVELNIKGDTAAPGDQREGIVPISRFIVGLVFVFMDLGFLQVPWKGLSGSGGTGRSRALLASGHPLPRTGSHTAALEGSSLRGEAAQGISRGGP